MSRVASIALCLVWMALAAPAAGFRAPDGAFGRALSDGSGQVFGGPVAFAAKAEVDTLLLMGPWGSGASANGQFQDGLGRPAWNGWTSVDLTRPGPSRWHADTVRALAGAWSAWCGSGAFPACDAGDPAGGYGNHWREVMEWRGVVADPLQPCTVGISALVRTDTEPGYDYAFVTAARAGGDTDLWTRDGIYGPAVLALQTVYQPGDYLGDGGDEVVVRFRFTSDGGWSDEDCSWPTDGAIRVDDVALALSNGTGYAHDFEDGTLGDLEAVHLEGVGDFARIRRGLQTPAVFCDDVSANTSPMVAFIDDGIVVPGTGGSPCINNCYGPGGFVVNHTGGLLGDQGHIHNAIESPAMPWPGPDYGGGTLWFDVFRHETLGANSTGMFFTWSVRSTADTDAAALAAAPWRDRNFVHYGGPDWARFNEPVGDLIGDDARWVQVQLAVYELGWVWGFAGTDGTPAPYFDNVRLAAHSQGGLIMTARVNELPHDAFPESGNLDPANLGANHVRFDSGMDISDDYDGRNDPGDSVVVRIQPVAPNGVLAAPPRMHWRLKRNPLFDPYRTAGLPDEGSTEGWDVGAGWNSYAFDLPDTGFLFPGDFLYYYFSATELVAGDLKTTLLPADTTGFSDFDDPMAYPPIYKLHALPTLREQAGQPGQYEQPSLLFWDDGGAAGNRDEWYMALRNLGLTAGQDYDIYYTSGPSLQSGHGLGGRATLAQIAGYTDMMYTSGVQAFTLSDGTGLDPSEDVQLLTAWLAGGGRDLLLAGDDIAGELSRSSTPSQLFLHDWMGVDLVQENVLDVLDATRAPLVVADGGAGVLATVDRWSASASCLSASWTNGYYNVLVTTAYRYDGVVPRAGAVRLAEFTDGNGAPGVYAFSAATLNVRNDAGSRVISLPYDLQSVFTDDGAKSEARAAARSRLLGDVLTWFGRLLGAPSAVPEAGVFAADNYPNPFNPITTIRWSLPRAAELSVQVYDVRGRLVSTLAHGPAAAGPGQARWDGRGDDGDPVAAGVYFYRVRAGDELLVGKMALIK